MLLKAIIHEEEAGGYWAEIPALPGCASQGETMDDLLANLREAVEGWLSVDIGPLQTSTDRILEIAF